MPDLIPVQKPQLPRFSVVEKYFKKIDENRIYTNFGPLNREFELRCAEFLNIDSDQLVTCANATLALEAALATNPTGLTSWELPSWTFTATASSVVRSGFEGHFRDVDDSWRIVPSGSVSGLLEVLPFGLGLRHDQLYSECTIIDAAASFGSLEKLNLNYLKNTGIVVSFHATKIFPAGEGGLFISKDTNWVKDVKKWINFGMQGSRESQIIGSNGKMSEYHSAVGLATFDEWESNKKKWEEQNFLARKISEKYQLVSHEAIRTGLINPYWILEFKDQSTRDKFSFIANEFDVETRLWWSTGAHKMKSFQRIFKVSEYELKKTNFLGSATLGLPMYLDLSTNEWRRIEQVFEKFKEETND